MKLDVRGRTGLECALSHSGRLGPTLPVVIRVILDNLLFLLETQLPQLREREKLITHPFFHPVEIIVIRYAKYGHISSILSIFN